MPGALSPSTFPDAVANKNSVYLKVAELTLTSLLMSKSQSCKDQTSILLSLSLDQKNLIIMFARTLHVKNTNTTTLRYIT